MWIFLSNAMLSIIEPPGKPVRKKQPRSDMLLVRARIKGDIERIFPKAVVSETPVRDYRFRANIPRAIVAAAMQHAVETINYDNFKSSVPLHEKGRHDAYLRVWGVMHAEQQRRASHSRPGWERNLFGADWEREDFPF